MGYLTFFDLSWDIEEGSAEEAAIMAWIEADEIRENFEDLYPGGACGQSKWRKEEADMARLSAAFPEVLFTLSGSGEEETDLWCSYYRGGLVQHAPAQIHYPEFAPTSLKQPDHSQHNLYSVAGEDTPEADALANHQARNGPFS